MLSIESAYIISGLSARQKCSIEFCPLRRPGETLPEELAGPDELHQLGQEEGLHGVQGGLRREERQERML